MNFRDAVWRFILSFCLVQELFSGNSAYKTVWTYRHLVAHEGGTITLRCRIAGHTGQVSWQEPKTQEQISINKTIKYELRRRMRIHGDTNQGQYDLHIHYIKFPDDNGTWHCYEFGGFRNSTELTVLVPPATENPTITPDHVAPSANGALWLFTCVGHRAHPPVNLTWVRKTGPSYPFDAPPQRVLTGRDQTSTVSAVLVLGKEHNDSIFTCVAKHLSFGRAEYSTDLHFFIPPGHTVMHLPPRPWWMIDLGPGNLWFVITAGLLLFILLLFCSVLLCCRRKWALDVRPRSGYTKLATKGYTSISSHANADLTEDEEVDGEDNAKPPVFTAVPHDQEVMDFSSLTLECIVSGVPKPAVTWFKNDRELLNSQHYRQHMHGNVARLTIPEIFPDDSSDFKAVAKNSAGEQSAVMTVVVKEDDVNGTVDGAPIFTRCLKDMTVTMASSVTLKCAVSAEPDPNITWYKNGTRLVPQVGFRQYIDRGVLTLAIRSLFPEDSGFYECVAHNKCGTKRNGCNVIVKVPVSSEEGKARRRCMCQLAYSILLFVLLVVALASLIPWYFKGKTPPTGHDVRVNFLPGGMLWLDCADLAMPKASLLHLTWRKNTEAFYYQDFSDGTQNYLARSRLARRLGSRVQVSTLGQMGIHPASFDDQGTYSCDALVILANGVMARVNRRIFTAVIDHIQLDTVFLGVVSAAIVVTFALMGLAIYHTLKWISKDRVGEPEV